MLKRLLIPSSVMLAPFVLTFACGGSDSTSSSATGLDTDHNGLADDLGVYVDVNPHDGKPDTIDINHDGKQDGIAVDTTGKGVTANGLLLDMDCDGVFDSVDTNGDGLPDYQTRRAPVTPPASCHPVNPVTGGQAGGGSGGAGGAPVVSGGAGGGVIAHGGGSGSTTSGGAGAPTVTAGAGGSTMNTNGQLGKGVYQGSGDTTDRYAEGDVYRGGIGYKFIANGWGTNWQNHHITWNGTSFNVKTLNGTQGSDYSPAGYPTMFCGLYSKKQSDDCGLPMTIASAKAIKTGWRWKANGSGGQFNAAWDIWLGDGGNLSSYLMVWLHDPPGQQPAGSASLAGAKVTGLPGSWNVWKGDVKGIPIVNYVQPEGQDLGELEFDVLDVYRDALKQNPNIRGSQILAVAVGYEVWNGPVTNLETDDFYVDAK